MSDWPSPLEYFNDTMQFLISTGNDILIYDPGKLNKGELERLNSVIVNAGYLKDCCNAILKGVAERKAYLSYTNTLKASIEAESDTERKARLEEYLTSLEALTDALDETRCFET